MKLYATPLSHFSRKVRLLLDHYGIEYEFVHIGNVVDTEAARFDGNPLMKVPVLHDGDTWLIESDHIAEYIVRRHDPADRYRVLVRDPDALNLRAMLNGIMNEEVKLILGARTGIDVAALPFFRKVRLAVSNGLEWLERNAARFDAESPGYLEFHLVCLLDHLDHYKLVPLDYPELKRITVTLSASPTVSRSNPGNSLAAYPPP